MNTILNFAHRGFTANFPDNTLEAFEAAVELGADGVEFDVRETADSTFVIFHDTHVRGKAIDKLEYDDIRKIKLKGKYRIPTLEETFDLLAKRIILQIELKQVQSLDRFLSLLKARTGPDDAVVSSFNTDLVSRVSAGAPGIRTAVITGVPVIRPFKLMEEAQCSGIVARYPFFSAGVVKSIHSRSGFCYAWDGRTPEDFRKIISLGVDGIISDFPDRAQKALQEMTG